MYEFINESLATIKKSYLRGWNERNGGNFSYQLTAEEVRSCQKKKGMNISVGPLKVIVGSIKIKTGVEDDEDDQVLRPSKTKRVIDLPFQVRELANSYFLVTASGSYFDGLEKRINNDLGIIKINDQGTQYTILNGYANDSLPTSELPTHLLTHAIKQKTTGQSRVVYHCHPPAIVGLSFILPHNSARWTREIWDVMAECAVVIPEGIGVLPWYVPGSAEIGTATSKLMTQHNLVVWAHHGVFCAGPNPREAFSKVDVFEKAAYILSNVIAMGGRRNTIPNEEIRKLGKAFKVELWKPALDVNLRKIK